MGRSKSVSLLLSAITGLLVVLLVSVFVFWATTAFHRQQEAEHVLSVLDMERTLLSVRQNLRNEGGFTFTIFTNPQKMNAQTESRLAQLHANSNASLMGLNSQLTRHPLLGKAVVIAEIKSKWAAYSKLLPAVTAQAKMSAGLRSKDLNARRSAAINAVLNTLNVEATALASQILAADTFVNEMNKITDVAWRLRTDAGIDRNNVQKALLAGRALTVDQLKVFVEINGRIDSPWALIEDNARLPAFPVQLRALIDRADQVYFKDFRAMRENILDKLMRGGPVPVSSDQWMTLSEPSLDSLVAVAGTALDLAADHVAVQVQIARQNFFIAIGLMILSILLACLAMFCVMWRVIRPLNRLTNTMRAVAVGDLDHEIPFKDRGDEIGQFAHALAMFRDAALERERLKAEVLEIQSAKETAEAASRVKSEFLANMSHELRTPLNAVIGFSELMLHKTFGPLSDRYREYAKLIHESGNHLLSLVSDILDLAKIEAGRFQADFRSFDIKACAEECMPLVRAKAEERKLVLRAELPAGPVTIVADQRACKQILLNLLSNAVKFSRPGGKVTLSVADLGDTVRLSVRDEGIGIPAAVLERIGQPFEQASNNPMLAREGTGLGLSVVKALAREHGGEMKVDSRENAGTTITIILPRIQAGRQAA